MTQPTIVGLIGNQSKMAQGVASPLFSRTGCGVIGSDSKNLRGLSNREVAEQADVIFILTLPIAEVRGVIEEIIPYVRPGTLILHGTSIQSPVRQDIAALLLTPQLKAKGVTTGFCHFMFAAMIRSLRGQSVIYGFLNEPDRTWREWLVPRLERERLITWESSAEFHDWLTGETQVIPMLAAILTGQMLTKHGLDLGQALQVAGPPFLLQALGVVRNHLQPAMMAEILINHPYTEAALRTASETLEAIRQYREAGDVHGLTRLAEQFRESIPRDQLTRMSEITDWHVQLEGDLRSGAIFFSFSREENRLGLLRDVAGVFDEYGLGKTSSGARETQDGGCIFFIGVKDPDDPRVSEAYAEVTRRFGGKTTAATR